jgi:hypothetical protein
VEDIADALKKVIEGDGQALAERAKKSGAAGIGGPAVFPVERSGYLKATDVRPPESSPAP